MDIPGLDVSRETIERLQIYERLVRKWNPAINLISKATITEIWGRHIRDSLQIANILPQRRQNFADFGSGGGFPGMVLAIHAHDAQKDSRFTLVESDKRKSVFLRTVARETGIRCTILDARIENIDPLGADIVTARALASLSELFELSKQHGHAETKYIFMKGQKFGEEVEEARKQWTFDIETHESLTDKDSRILEIWGLERAK